MWIQLVDVLRRRWIAVGIRRVLRVVVCHSPTYLVVYRKKIWILLLYELPTKQNSQRVNLWRKLKKSRRCRSRHRRISFPMHRLITCASSGSLSKFRDGGSDATLNRVTEIEGLGEADLVRLFDDARAHEYAELRGTLNELLKLHPRASHRRSRAYRPFSRCRNE
jgi:hypothetical protein